MRVFHISDLHFGNENTDMINAFLMDCEHLKPDLIIISGDLTQRARTKQFQSLESFLNVIKCKTLMVPGNHDVPLWNPFERIIRPFYRYKKYTQSEIITKWSHDQINVLGLCSVDPSNIKNGQLSQQDFESIANYFKPDTDQVNLLFFHHNFDYRPGAHKPLENHQAFMTCLKSSHVDIICTGHLHFAQTAIFRKNNSKPCLSIHAGSLSCNRSKDNLNSYYCIDLNKRQCLLQWRVFRGQTFSSDNEYDINLEQSID